MRSGPDRFRPALYSLGIRLFFGVSVGRLALDLLHNHVIVLRKLNLWKFFGFGLRLRYLRDAVRVAMR